MTHVEHYTLITDNKLTSVCCFSFSKNKRVEDHYPHTDTHTQTHTKTQNRQNKHVLEIRICANSSASASATTIRNNRINLPSFWDKLCECAWCTTAIAIASAKEFFFLFLSSWRTSERQMRRARINQIVWTNKRRVHSRKLN